MIIEEYTAKSLVRPSSPSPFAWMDYSLNPYQGCAHDCRYCDGKSERYRMHEDFGRRIRVKRNAPELLERFLKNKGLKSARMMQGTLFDQYQNQAGFTLFIGGGVCDVYQPAEGKVRIMRQLLQLAYDYGTAILILTKSSRVLDDLDILQKINQETYAGVNLTITLADQKLSSIFEPGASMPEERFHAIRCIREAGLHSGVYLMPILPFIGDTDENIASICSQAQASGAEFVHLWGLTLTPGRNKDEFLQTVKEHFPELLSKYRLLYENEDSYGKPDIKAARRLSVPKPELKTYRYIYELGLDYTAKRFIPLGRIRTNLRAAEVLMRAAYLKRVLLNDWQEAKKLAQAAYLVEAYHQDIFELSEVELQQLGCSRETWSYLSDLSNDDRSSSLIKLEALAYQRALGSSFDT